MAFSNVHYVSIYQTVTSLTYVFVPILPTPQIVELIAIVLDSITVGLLLRSPLEVI